MADSEYFSRIQFPGLTKQHKPLLHAMRKPNNPPAPPSFLSKFKNSLKSDENPQPKQIILTDNPYKYNPLTKKYEFGGETQEKEEEFNPPPTGFLNKEVKGAGKKYVDVIGEDVNLAEYKPHLPDLQTPVEKIQIEEKKVEEPQKVNFSDSWDEDNDEKIRKLKEIAQIEKKMREDLQNDFLMVCEVGDKVEGEWGFEEKLVLEQELVELNSGLLSKICENLELNEKIINTETQVKDLKHQLEVMYEENNLVVERFKEENMRIAQELFLFKEKTGEVDLEAESRVKELEKEIEHLQLRINFDTQSRVNSEINEKRLIGTVKELESDFVFAVKTIKGLNAKCSQLLQENQNLSSAFLSTTVNSSDVFELLQVNTENLTLKKKINDLFLENSGLRKKESELVQKLKDKSGEVNTLEQAKKILQDKVMKDSKKELENEISKLNSRYLIEKNGLNLKIKNLNSMVNELRKGFHDLKVKENDYEIQIGELQSEISALKSENSLLATSESHLIEQEKSLKLSKAALSAENLQLLHNNEKLKASFQDTCTTLDTLKQQNESLSIKIKNLSFENEKKVLELSKNHQKTESRLKKQLQDSEESLKILEDQIKSADSKILTLTEALHQSDQLYQKDSQTLKIELLQETEEKNILSQELKITKDSLTSELESLHRKIEQQKFITGKLEQEVTENCGIREENQRIKEGLRAAIEEKNKIGELMQKKNEEVEEMRGKLEELESEKASLSSLLAGASDENLMILEKMKEFESENLDFKEKMLRRDKDFENLKNSLEIQLESAENEIKVLGKSCEKMAKELEIVNNEKVSILEQAEFDKRKVESIEKERELLITEQKRLKDLIEHLEQKIQSDFKENEAINQYLQESREAFKRLETDLTAFYTEELTKSESEKNDLSEENIKIYSEISKLEVHLNTLQNENENLTQTNSQLLKELQLKSTETQILQSRLKTSDQSSIIQSLESKLALLQTSLDSSNSSKLSLEVRLQSITTNNNSLLSELNTLKQEKSKQSLQISSLTHELETLSHEKLELKEQIILLEQPKQKSSISEMFLDTPHLSESFTNEKFDLETQIHSLSAEKSSLTSQISDLIAENDALYEKNLDLVSQNQLLQQELKSKAAQAALLDLEKRLNEKEEELKLVKENFHELLQKTLESQPTKKPEPANTQDGWFSSVLGTIFLTDKERGT